MLRELPVGTPSGWGRRRAHAVLLRAAPRDGQPARPTSMRNRAVGPGAGTHACANELYVTLGQPLGTACAGMKAMLAQTWGRLAPGHTVPVLMGPDNGWNVMSWTQESRQRSLFGCARGGGVSASKSTHGLGQCVHRAGTSKARPWISKAHALPLTRRACRQRVGHGHSAPGRHPILGRRAGPPVLRTLFSWPQQP